MFAIRKGERKETGNFILVKVLDVFSDPEYVKEGYVIMSIRPCKIAEIDWDYAPWYAECDASTPVLPKSKGSIGDAERKCARECEEE